MMTNEASFEAPGAKARVFIGARRHGSSRAFPKRIYEIASERSSLITAH